MKEERALLYTGGCRGKWIFVYGNQGFKYLKSWYEHRCSSIELQDLLKENKKDLCRLKGDREAALKVKIFHLMSCLSISLQGITPTQCRYVGKFGLLCHAQLQNSIKSDVAYLDNVCIEQIIPSIFCKLIKLAICSQFLVNIFLWSRLVLTAIELESWLCCLSFGERFLRAFLRVFKCLRCFGAPFCLM